MLDIPESPPRVRVSLSPQPGPLTSTRPFRRTSRDLSKLGNRLNQIELSDDPQFRSEFMGLENDIEMLRDEQRRLQRESHELEGRIKEMTERLNNRERRRKDLHEITKKLTMTQKYLSMADSRPQAEVVRAMETLNEEIFQLTSIVADMIQVEEKITPKEKNVKTFSECLERFLKPEFVLEVIAPKRLDDTLAIQMCWQAILVRWCARVIQRWMPTENEEVNDVLARMYGGIAAKNEQPIAGRWRAIARHAVQKSFPVKSKPLVDLAIGALLALPVLCGYIRNQEQYDKVSGAFQSRIEQLLNKCLDFRKMVGEGFTSVDIEPYWYDPGDYFDPKHADLDYEDDESAERGGSIACTLCLGLSKSYKSKDEEGNIKHKKEPILKPKVILQETLIAIIS